MSHEPQRYCLFMPKSVFAGFTLAVALIIGINDNDKPSRNSAQTFANNPTAWNGITKT